MSQEGPTISRRMQPGFILITTDDRLGGELQAAAGENWQVAVFPAIEDAGEWNEILLYRFILMDLDEAAGDPVAQVERIRVEYMINTPIFCFGGSKEVRDQARLKGGDRFFDRDEIVGKLPEFMEALGWGG